MQFKLWKVKCFAFRFISNSAEVNFFSVNNFITRKDALYLKVYIKHLKNQNNNYITTRGQQTHTTL